MGRDNMDGSRGTRRNYNMSQHRGAGRSYNMHGRHNIGGIKHEIGVLGGARRGIPGRNAAGGLGKGRAVDRRLARGKVET